MSEHTLEFDEAAHAYQLDGAAVPSVTTVIGAVWPELWEWCTDFAKERGRVIHKALNFALKDTLDWDSVDPFLTGYITAGLRAIRELEIEVAASEERLYSVANQFAGTLDIRGTRKGKTIIADFKSGDPGLACGLQTAAYAEARFEMTGERTRERIALWLHQNGTYHVRTYNDRADWGYFLSALNVYRWAGGKIAERKTEERNAA